MRPLLIIAILALVACRTAPVACDAHLTPINPVAKPAAVTDGGKQALAAQPAARAQGSGR